MRITRELLRQWRACYDDKKIAALVPPEGLDWRGIVALDIPPRDRLWVLLHDELIPARELRLLAGDWAEASLALIPPDKVDQRSRDAIAVLRRFASGQASQEELAAAWDAASAAASAAARDVDRDVAWNVAWDAASAAASAAAWDVDRDVAWNVAWAAAWDAASAAASAADRDVAWAAAWAAAWEKQLAEAVAVLTRIEKKT